MNAGFFAIGKPQWGQVCGMGLNHAVSFLVLARGTGRDNATTRWGAESVAKYTGMAWRRAHDAIAAIDKTELVTSAIPKGKRTTRKLAIPTDPEQWLWLPNTLVAGAKGETPPVAKLRQGQDVEHLQTFVELYGLHDLIGDGGLPRGLILQPFDVREHICDRGPFKVYGFQRGKHDRCFTIGPLERFHKRKDNTNDVWHFIRSMERMGLLGTVDYLAESDSPDAELIHALTGDDHARKVADAAAVLADSLPDGFRHEAESYTYTLPVLPHLGKATVVGVWRLTYRPHTRKTGAWLAQHVERCGQYANQYMKLAGGDSAAPDVDIKGYQGLSKVVNGFQGS
jgi:hypothetical protein